MSVVYPGGIRALDSVSIDVAAGKTTALVGASGCGKTTLLRLINRLVSPASGRVLVRGRDVSGEDPIQLRRGIGYVIQDAGLIPHWSVEENVAVVPRLLGWEEGRVREAAGRWLAAVRLDSGVFAGRYPASLSGGQRQRVAVARALAADPEILLMDEPFGALDPALREELQDEFRELARALGKTVLFVTHDMHEAVHVSDQIAVLCEGRLLQAGEPADIVLRPGNDYVSRLLGRRRAELESYVRGKA